MSKTEIKKSKIDFITSRFTNLIEFSLALLKSIKSNIIIKKHGWWSVMEDHKVG